MEIKLLSETSVPVYQTRWHNILQDLSLQIFFLRVCVISNIFFFLYHKQIQVSRQFHSRISAAKEIAETGMSATPCPLGLAWFVSNCSYFSAKLQRLCASCSHSKWNLSLGYADIFSIHLPVSAGLFLVGKWLEGFLDLLGNILDPVLRGLYVYSIYSGNL